MRQFSSRTGALCWVICLEWYLKLFEGSTEEGVRLGSWKHPSRIEHSWMLAPVALQQQHATVNTGTLSNKICMLFEVEWMEFLNSNWIDLINYESGPFDPQWCWRRDSKIIAAEANVTIDSREELKWALPLNTKKATRHVQVLNL